MFEYVIDLGLKPKRPYAKRGKTNLIILHHASGKTPKTKAEEEQLVRDYHQMHINKGNRGIDYNFLVGPLGNVYKGRGLEFEGGHVLNSGKSAGMNARSIGICALGDLEKNQMPAAQKEALKRLTRDVARHYDITDIIPHKAVKNTDCPGKNYPLAEIKAYALDAGEAVPPDHGLELVPGESKVVYKVTVGDLNMRSGPSTKDKVIKMLHWGDLVQLGRYNPPEKWARVFSLPDKNEGFVWLEYIGER